MIALLVIVFLLYAVGIALLLFMPKLHFKQFFQMEEVTDSEYRKKRKNYGRAFYFLGMIVVSLMILLAGN